MKMREGYMIKEVFTYIDVLPLIILFSRVFTCARHIHEEVTPRRTCRICLPLLQILEID